VTFQETFTEVLSPAERASLAGLLPECDRRTALADGRLFESGVVHAAVRHYHALLRAGLLETEGAAKWLPPRPRDAMDRCNRCAGVFVRRYVHLH
jgi:hypothetical protein